MKIKLHKILAMIILTLLILPMLTYNTYAIEYSDVLSEETRGVLQILSIYGLMEGHDPQNFRPGNCITKAELAKIATVLLGYNEYIKGMESHYIDMQGHWAEQYVDLIDELDILRGNDDNTYEPNKNISYSDSIIAILKVLGYENIDISNNSAESYVKLAKDLGLLNNINNPSEQYITRESMAHLLYNALFTNTVEMKSNELKKTDKLLLNNIGRKATEKIDDIFALKHPYIDLSEYMLNIVDVYYDITGKILYIDNPLYKIIEGDVVSAVSTNIIFLSDKYNNKTIYNLSNVPVVYNGIRTIATNEDLKYSYIKLIIDNSNESERIIGAVVNKVSYKKVIDASSLYKEGDLSFAGKALPTRDGKLSLEYIKVIGDATSIYDIQEDDLVYFYETKEADNDKSTLMLQVVRNSVSGIFEGKSIDLNGDYFTINSQNYKFSPEFKWGEDFINGDSIKVILNLDGKIIHSKILKYNKEPEKYGMVINVNNYESLQLPKITIINKQGKTLSLELKENSGEVSKEIIDRTPKYSTALNKGDFIKYDLYNNNSIKIIKKVDTANIAASYDSKTGVLNNQAGSISSATTIIHFNNNRYEKLSNYSLKNYVEGKAVFNSNGIAEIFNLEKNYTKITDTPTPEVPNPVVTPPANTKFTGSIYGAIQTISTVTGTQKVKLYNFNTSYSVDNNLSKDLKSYKNQLVKLKITNNVIVDIVAYSAEISKSTVTAIYNGQLQIDDISYIEYSKDVLVFTCKYDSSGSITSFSTASISDIKINSSLKFYNINKNYSGVMDIIIIYN